MEKVFERKLSEKLEAFIERKEILGIRGPRQAGKTTLLKVFERKVKGNTAFVNMDLLDYRQTLESNPIDFVKRFEKPGEKLFLFLDEVQKVKNGGEKLKIIFDEFPEVKIFISGSSSMELKTNILPFLVGRLFLFELFTFDFGEFLSAKDKGLAKLHKEKNSAVWNFIENGEKLQEQAFSEAFLKQWKEFAVFGGYPEVIKAKSIEERKTILKNIFNLYLEKDISAFFKIEKTSVFADLARILAFNTGNLLSVSPISSELNSSYKEIEEFINILQHTYTIQLVRPFHKNIVTEIKKAPKTYYMDLGMRNCAINNFTEFDQREDKGKLLENFVFRQLIEGSSEWKINYWRTTGKAEVDFVLTKGKKIVPVEVKLSGGKLGKSFYSFIKAYKPEKAIIVTLNEFREKSIGKTKVCWIPAYYL